MSHQTGITCGDDLKDVFRDCTTDGSIRCVKVGIEDETLVCSECVDKCSDSWKGEYDDVILNLLVAKQPCYLLYQLASKSEWLMITFSPDDSPVREKMLYAATRSTLKQEFGGGFIADEVFGTSENDVSYKGYMEHKAHKDAPPPLTNAEEELKFLDETESNSGIGNTTRHQTVQGIEFPITKDAQQALSDFKEGVVNHVELNVDLENETIFKVCSKLICASDLEGLISEDRAGYHIFNYAHRHNGEDKTTVFFVYSMPGYSIPIKARMLYSSCKAPLLSAIEEDFEIKLDKKLECDSTEKLTEEYLRNEAHPPAVEAKQNFSKPKAPGRRAPTRKPRGAPNGTE
ncbi:unnamed protein product [Clavelina lepadiformis]|uniref:ADF-H domain-containing protein n=1 Tax=Clavelina lepadiformis TaxID=159417 RepID=A0ABP0G5B5_CLALP